MRSVALFAVLTLGTGLTLGAAAQAPAPASALLLSQPGSQNCPIRLDARRLPFGSILQAGHTARTHRPALRLTFFPETISPLVNAQGTLHGFSGDHAVPADSASRADSTEPFSVSASPGVNYHSASTIYPERLGSVKWIELNQLKFSDGTQWHATAGSVCRFVPDVVLQVASGR